MQCFIAIASLVLTLVAVIPNSHAANAGSGAELGSRPAQLIESMREGALKARLQACAAGPFETTDFSIGHRGAPLMYPEHTRESYEAAARMGAGIVECDVTFTRDKALVCRHSQCDLHTTTDILASDFAGSCRKPFQPAVFDQEGRLVEAASAECCTSDITLSQFKTLRGKKDSYNPRATTAREYLALKDGDPMGTLLTHRESIRLLNELNVKMAPELKSSSVPMPFKGMSQADYAQKFIDEYKVENIASARVWPQSFNLTDVLYWIKHEPAFGSQAVYLDDRDSSPEFDHRDPTTWEPGMTELAEMGVKILAPPIWMLLEAEGDSIVPSRYARDAKAAGLDIIAWSLERSGSLRDGGGWYYQTLNGELPNPTRAHPGLIRRDGDVFWVLDVLANEVGVIAVFSDWPATTTYYANCMGLE